MFPNTVACAAVITSLPFLYCHLQDSGFCLMLHSKNAFVHDQGS